MHPADGSVGLMGSDGRPHSSERFRGLEKTRVRSASKWDPKLRPAGCSSRERSDRATFFTPAHLESARGQFGSFTGWTEMRRRSGARGLTQFEGGRGRTVIKNQGGERVGWEQTEWKGCGGKHKGLRLWSGPDLERALVR